MTKFRTYKKYSLVYNLENNGAAYVISIEKSNANGVERSAYTVHGSEAELKSLLCRLWRCGVTPLSLVYILEDEGYIIKDKDNDSAEGQIKNGQIVRRQCPYVGKAFSLLAKSENKSKALAAACNENTVNTK